MLYPVCEHGCSSAASECPECKHPLKPQLAAPVSTPDVQLTEQTGKRWKGMMIAGALMAVGGCGTSVLMEMLLTPPKQSAAGRAPALMGFVGLAGIVLFIYARIAAWWHHG